MESFLKDIIDFDGKLNCSSNETHILIVDYKQLEFTKNIINCILLQDTKFDLTIFEQTPDEKTRVYMEDLKNKWNLDGCVLNVVYNSVNAPLNHIWNWFYKNTTNDYLAILNNDIEICDNFVSDAIKIFEKESDCGFIIHPTNRKEFTKSNKLKYEILETGYLQGWDFIIKREAYVPIPDDLWIYAGDDFLLKTLIYNGYKEIYDISSPIIHYRSITINENKEQIEEICKRDSKTFREKYNKNIRLNYSDNKYTSRKFIEKFNLDLTK